MRYRRCTTRGDLGLDVPDLARSRGTASQWDLSAALGLGLGSTRQGTCSWLPAHTMCIPGCDTLLAHTMCISRAPGYTLPQHASPCCTTLPSCMHQHCIWYMPPSVCTIAARACPLLCSDALHGWHRCSCMSPHMCTVTKLNWASLRAFSSTYEVQHTTWFGTWLCGIWMVTWMVWHVAGDIDGVGRRW